MKKLIYNIKEFLGSIELIFHNWSPYIIYYYMDNPPEEHNGMLYRKYKYCGIRNRGCGAWLIGNRDYIRKRIKQDLQ